MKRLATTVLCAALALFATTDAVAQGKPKPATPKAIPLPADAVKRLKSGDAAQVKTALDDVRTSGKAGAPAVAAIVDLLRQGISPESTKAAIETLGDVESEAASEVLAWYSRHRDAAIRRATAVALAKTRGAAAVKALRASLSDPDAAVRGLAATSLGGMNAKEAVGDLFVALDHRVHEAAASIGQLCAGGECERLAGKLGSVPLVVVTGGLDQVLFRPSGDVSDDIKLKIVGSVRELGTGEANRFLRDVQKKWPDAWSKRVRRAVDQAVLATSASPGAAGAP